MGNTDNNENKDKSFFPPKGTEGRPHDTMVLHIQGLILVLVLIIALASSFSILGRSILSMLMGSVGGEFDSDSMNQVFELAGMGSLFSAGFSIFSFVSKTLGVVSYIAAFVSLGAAIYIIILMKNRVAMILDDPVPFENPIRVKKAAYVWLGFLLGAYGGHLFLLKKKKAWAYLAMGIVGMEIVPLFLYTSGMSFADAFLACFLEKDDEGYIEIEYYPYWI